MPISFSPVPLRFCGTPKPSETHSSQPSTPPFRPFKKELTPTRSGDNFDKMDLVTDPVTGDHSSHMGLEDLPPLQFRRASGALQRRNTTDFTTPNSGSVRPQVHRRHTSSAVDDVKSKPGHRRTISKEVRMRRPELQQAKKLKESLQRAQEIGKNSTAPKKDFGKEFEELSSLLKKF